MNYICISGNLCRDVDYRIINSNGNEYHVARFTVAWNQKLKNKEKVFFGDVSAWGFHADKMQNGKRGDAVVVFGQIVQEKYKLKSGEEKTRNVIEAETVEFIRRTAKAEQQQNTVTSNNASGNVPHSSSGERTFDNDDDIPF